MNHAARQLKEMEVPRRAGYDVSLRQNPLTTQNVNSGYLNLLDRCHDESQCARMANASKAPPGAVLVAINLMTSSLHQCQPLHRPVNRQAIRVSKAPIPLALSPPPVSR